LIAFNALTLNSKTSEKVARLLKFCDRMAAVWIITRQDLSNKIQHSAVESRLWDQSADFLSKMV
jgi:hypothetical protein